MVKFALRIMKFYPTKAAAGAFLREGTTWLKKMLQRMHDGMARERYPLIGELSKNMVGADILALGDARRCRPSRLSRSFLKI